MPQTRGVENSLFAYGSLMFPEVWIHVVGRERPSVEAILKGHLAFTVRGHSFPGLVPTSPNDTTPGRLYRDLSAEDWSRLDAFEDTFYQRHAVEVCDPEEQCCAASAYLVDPAERAVLSTNVWSRQWFAEHALGEFLDRIAGFA